MKADISAYTFVPERHFDAVVVGQGQVLVDSALNEQQEIARFRATSTTIDVVGGSGVPKLTGGFQITVAPDGLDLLVAPGRMYVDGILCVNEPPVVGANATSATVLTADTASPAGRAFAADQWVDVTVGITTSRSQISGVSGRTLVLKAAVPGLVGGSRLTVRPVTSLRHQPDRFPFDPFLATDPAHLTANAYRVELDAWHRHITPVEDPSIREVALGDADAATRVKVVWQLRLVQAGAVGGGSCATGPAGSPGQLVASTVPGLPSDDPCVLPDEAGYRGLENQLYRIEVHSATTTTVVLKWQRDNASTASKVLALGTTLLLDDMGRDSERGFETAPLVEVTDDHLELEQLVSDLLKVTGPPDKGSRTLPVAAAPAVAKLDRNARARRWDGQLTIDLTSPTAAQPQPLERGIQVALVPGLLSPGDYWMVPARTTSAAGGGTIGGPTDDAGNALPQAPHGIAHHRASLAIVDSGSTAFLTAPTNLRDCRISFPPLTAIAATDVSVDGTPCGFAGVTNVQQAIDALCNRGSGLCTATATPGPGWESVFATVAAKADAQICFPVGTYPVTKRVVVQGKGNLILQGAGPGSVVDAGPADGAIVFSGCASVAVRALTVRSGSQAGTGGLTFTSCGDVAVRDCLLVGSTATNRQAGCLNVSSGTLEVTGTRFQVGDRQEGVRAFDASRVLVRDCQFRVVPAPAAAPTLVAATALEKLQARRLLVSGLSPVAATGQRVGLTIGKQTMSFITPGPVKTAWSTALKPTYDSMKHFQKSLDKVLRAVFSGAAAPGADAIAAFVKDRILSRRVAVMAAAIVIGGRTVGDVRVEGNDIDPAIRGVHIGVSHALQPRTGPPDVAGRVTITGNQIRVLVPPEGARARHAIFVGNAERLRITGNDVSFDGRAEGDPITSDGIRIYGFVGRAMTIRDNVVDSFPGGITLNLFQQRGGGQATLARMWAVEDNLVIGAGTPISTSGPLKAFVKFRGNRPGPADN